MIKLERFTKSDIDRLISWIPDDRFLLQWAGPKYSFPLDAQQLHTTLTSSNTRQPEHLAFKAVDTDSTKVIGHIELMNIDHTVKSAHIGRVLIGPAKDRGKGRGIQMLKQLIDFAFEDLGLIALTLSVFDFNSSAIQCYKKLGFEQIEFKKNARKYRNENWNLIVMKLEKQHETGISSVDK